MKNNSFRYMCEYIEKSDILVRADGSSPTAKEIFEYSPSGELEMVYRWFEIAKMINAKIGVTIKLAESRGLEK